MIMIEPVGVQERARYPGSIQLPVIVPPSPVVDRVRPPPPEKKSSLWFFALITGAIALIGSSGAKAPRLGEAREGYVRTKKQPGNRLYYMYVPPGKWFQDAVSIPKKKLKEYQHRATTTPGALYYIWAESADTARYLLRTDKEARDDAHYQALLEVKDPPKASRKKPEGKLSDYWFWIPWGYSKADQITEAQVDANPDFYYGAEDRKRARLYRVPGFDAVSAKKLLSKELQKAREYKKKWGGKRNPYEPVYYAWKRGHGYRIVRDTNEVSEERQREAIPEPQPRRPAKLPTGPPEQLTLFSSLGRQGKQAWQMTRAEFRETVKRSDPIMRSYDRRGMRLDQGQVHAIEVREALKRGEPVPRQVLTDYPRFQEQPLSGGLSGRVENCAIWIPAKTGEGWVCGAYGRPCDPPTCAEPPDPRVKQIKVCVKDQSVFSRFYNRMITRCKRYETACEGPACMPFTMPHPAVREALPEAPAERRKPSESEVESIAQWMAEEYNEATFAKEPYLARDILSRGGIAPPKGVSAESEEYKSIPLFLRNRQGLPCDEMASEMQYDYCDDLREDIAKIYPIKAKGAWKKLRRMAWKDFEDAAFEFIEKGIEERTWRGLHGYALGEIPGNVWKLTSSELTALQREEKDPALPSELNWMLAKSKVTPDGTMREFKGDIPEHMKKRLSQRLFGMYDNPEVYLKDKRIKITRHDGGGGNVDYSIDHPFYHLFVRFWHRGRTMVFEDRRIYHAKSVEAALKAGKNVPSKVLMEYAPYIPEAKAALTKEPEQLTLLGQEQELFPGLKRELVLEEPEDIATSDDPVIACMERKGWKISRMEELRQSIAEKRTPDLFTLKTTRLTAGEKEYQRVMSRCLKVRSGTAGLGQARRPKRVRYDKADANSAINAAIRLAHDEPMYIFPTAYGFKIETEVAPWLNHYKVHPDGTVESHTRDIRSGEWTIETLPGRIPGKVEREPAEGKKTREPEQLRLLGRSLYGRGLGYEYRQM